MKEINFEVKIPKALFGREFLFYMKIIASITGIITGILFYNWEYFTLAGLFIFFYFILAMIWKINENFSLAFAVICFIATISFLLLEKDEWASNFAQYLYYFLIIITAQLFLDRAVDKPPRHPRVKIV